MVGLPWEQHIAFLDNRKRARSIERSVRAGVGPGPLDLAALTAGRWKDDQRRRLVTAYFDAWPKRLARPEWHDFADVLDHCRLHLAVQWIGWSPGWSPPPDHAHDWLGEALGLADELGV